MFVNQSAFNDPRSRKQAMGVDTRVAALVDAYGRVVAHPQTGGMISPSRHELHEGAMLYRFASSGVPLDRAVTGGWWVAADEFRKMCNFAQQHNVHVAMASRLLCCVPPEWSDMGLMVRARVNSPLLAYRGLGNNVSIEHQDGGRVRMQAHNDIAARRLHQLFIPGLVEYAGKTQSQIIPGALTLERHWAISKSQANGGWLYV